MHYGKINKTDINTKENMREDELKDEISNFKQKNVELEKQIEETELKILEYEEIIMTDKEASDLLTKELEQQNNILGKNSVQGSGIIVTLSDTRAQKITSEDLRELVNELKIAGAEAISINGQRIVYDSYIVDIGNTYIRINGQESMVSPYEVKAIGNPTYLESGISKKQYGYIDTKLEEGKDITLVRQENIVIDKYNGDLNMEYAN